MTEDLPGAGLHVLPGGVDRKFRVEGLFERVVHPGHFVDGAFLRAPVNSTRITYLADFDGALQPDLGELRTLDRPRGLSRGLVRGDHRHEDCRTIAGEHSGKITDPTGVDLTILPAEPQFGEERLAHFV